MTRSWQDILTSTIETRHWLHRHPELTWGEENTARLIRERLSSLHIPWRVCATLAAQAKGPHLAFRADMDALPIKETADVDYISCDPGKMHACGHDGHTAASWGRMVFWNSSMCSRFGWGPPNPNLGGRVLARPGENLI